MAAFRCTAAAQGADGDVLVHFTRHSLLRAKGEVLVLLYFFVRFSANDLSTTRGPIHAKFCTRA